MTVRSNGRLLSTVFMADYDNIYLSLKRKNEDAAKSFAKNASTWLKEMIQGRLITPTNGPAADVPRRIVMNRCYGNPVPRRNCHDNATDMNSFPFMRHHFLRAGFEVIDCPPLTAQLKNSSDIRMVMDVRDYLTIEHYFDEFVILSSRAMPTLRRCCIACATTPAAPSSIQRLHGLALYRDLRRRNSRSGPDYLPHRGPAAGDAAGRKARGAAADDAAQRSAARSLAQCHHRRGSCLWCGPRRIRCRSKRWPTAPCAISGMRRPQVRPGVAPVASATYWFARLPATSRSAIRRRFS